MRKILICGDYKNEERLAKYFERLHEEIENDDIKKPLIITSDLPAIKYAKQYNLEYRHYCANWKKYGYAAAQSIMNYKMILSKPDLVVVFGKSKDIVGRAKFLRIEVRIIK